MDLGRLKQSGIESGKGCEGQCWGQYCLTTLLMTWLMRQSTASASLQMVLGGLVVYQHLEGSQQGEERSDQEPDEVRQRIMQSPAPADDECRQQHTWGAD